MSSVDSLDLPKKPLVEAILELRWTIGIHNQLEDFSYYRMQMSKLHDRLNEEYSELEPIGDNASLPDELAKSLLQYRMRVEEKGWPLVQVGPGILTFNETEKYYWPDFCKRASAVVKALFDSNPNTKKLSIQITEIKLTFIDGIELEDTTTNVLDFLSKKMKTTIDIPNSLFEDGVVKKVPVHFSCEGAFPCESPAGVVFIKFAKGRVRDRAAMLMDTMVRSKGKDAPNTLSDVEHWLDKAHKVTSDWFKKITAGELMQRFSNE